MGTAIVAPFSSFTLKVSLMVSLFRPALSKVDEDQSTIRDESKQTESIRNSFNEDRPKKLETKSCFSLHLLGCFYKRDKAKEYKRMLAQSSHRLTESLDLRRIIESQEFVKMAFKVLLTSKQIRIVRHLSNKNLCLSADQLNRKELKKAQVQDQDQSQRLDTLISCLVASDDTVDRRLIEILEGKNQNVLEHSGGQLKDLSDIENNDIPSTNRTRRKDISKEVLERDKLIGMERLSIEEKPARNYNFHSQSHSTKLSWQP